MSKDEYLMTDTPLKALTVFAMPMILGSFFQQIYNSAALGYTADTVPALPPALHLLGARKDALPDRKSVV